MTQRGIGDRHGHLPEGFCLAHIVQPRVALVVCDYTIENGLHWVLDLAFQEDRSRLRKDHSQQNFVVLRHMALNLLKQEPTARCGIKARRLKAGWGEDYLRKVLAA